MLNYESMTDCELLSTIINEKEGEHVSERLLQDFLALQYLLIDASEQELIKIKGIGSKRAQQIKCCYELARRLFVKVDINGCAIKSPDDISRLVMPDLRYLKKEQFRIALLNTKNYVIEIKLVSEGSLSASIVHPREVFSLAVKRSAAAIILIHNHPSGDPEPSTEDIETTNRLVNAGNILGIKVLDHVVIGNGRYISLKERGVM